ncbi:hypothetical protein J2R96_005830 [Bradyrhizobium elkanii]|nr:hypothetical protein [Bradyrhizobium elkanii]
MRLANASDDRAGTAGTRLAEVTRELDEQELQLSVLETRVHRFESDREGVLAATVEADPTYVKKEDGFLARLRAVKRITEEDQTTLIMVIMLDIFLFCFEGAILMIKLFGADNMYAELAAAEELVHRNELVQELATVLNGDSTRPNEVAAGQVQVEAAVPDEVSAAEETVPRLPVEDEGLPKDVPSPEMQTPVRRGRGRPKGSRNRPASAPPGSTPALA